MNIFWLLVAVLVAAVASAYVFLLLPRLRSRLSNSRQGIAALMTGNKAPVIVAGIAIPLIAIALYLGASLKQAASPATASTSTQNLQIPPEHAEMIKALAARLEKNPEDGKGWVMLARSYATLGRFQDSADAYAKAANLIPNDPKILTDYADVLAMANGRQLSGKPLELVYSALKIDPNNSKGLLLAGKAAYQAGDYAHAVGYWQRLLQALPPDSDLAKQVTANINQAQALIK